MSSIPLTFCRPQDPAIRNMLHACMKSAMHRPACVGSLPKTASTLEQAPAHFMHTRMCSTTHRVERQQLAWRHNSNLQLGVAV